MTFGYYEGEDPEKTAEYVASLEVSLQGARDRGEADSAKQVEAELARVRGDKPARKAPGKENRLKGEARSK